MLQSSLLRQNDDALEKLRGWFNLLDLLWVPFAVLAFLPGGYMTPLLLLMLAGAWLVALWREQRSPNQFLFSFSSTTLALMLLLGCVSGAAVMVLTVETIEGLSGGRGTSVTSQWLFYGLIGLSLLNVLWLVFRAGPFLLWRFQLDANEQRLRLTSRYWPRRQIAAIRWDEPFLCILAQQRAHSWLVRSEEKSLVYVFSQDDTAIAVDAGKPAKRNLPAVASLLDHDRRLNRLYLVSAGPAQMALSRQLEKHCSSAPA